MRATIDYLSFGLGCVAGFCVGLLVFVIFNFNYASRITTNSRFTASYFPTKYFGNVNVLHDTHSGRDYLYIHGTGIIELSNYPEEKMKK